MSKRFNVDAVVANLKSNFGSKQRGRKSSERAEKSLTYSQLEDRRLLAAEIEPNNTLATATTFASPSDTLTGTISNLSDLDHFQVTLAAGETLQLRYSSNGSAGEPAFLPTMEILDDSGDVKSSSLDAHTFSYTAAKPGTYVVRLTSQSVFGTVTGTYSLEANVTSFNGTIETEGNDTQATANAIANNSNFQGSLASAGDVDFYSFFASAGQAVAIKFADKPDLNPSVRLYSPAGGLLGVDQNGLGLFSEITETGQYAFAIQSDNLTGTVTGDYVGQLLVATQPTLDLESGDGFDSATVLDLGPSVVSGNYLSPDASFTSSGLTGSYVNRSLRLTPEQIDWRVTHTIAGSRLDPLIHFPQDGWGSRATVNLTNGTDSNWDDFSVQWDGFLRVVTPGTRLYNASDDGSRMWIDLNDDGSFDSSGDEFIDNNWGSGQGTTISPASVPLAAGDYRIRIQYEEGNGGNQAYLLWDDVSNASGAVSRNNHRDGIGTLSSMSDIDVFAVDLTATGMYQFRFDNSSGAIATQSRRLTIYNEFGQPLDYSNTGRLTTDGWNTRPEESKRYYVSVQATDETGLGPYELVAQINREFPIYRDIPLFHQDYSGYSKTEQIPEFIAFFESHFDIYQVDVTETDPGTAEHVGWTFTDTGSGCGGSAGGWFGNRSVSGNGSGSCGWADWTRLADVWHGLFYHENGHGVGLFHARSPLNTMSYGGQYDYFPVGASNWMGQNGNGDARVSGTRVHNARNYMDWAFEAGRIVNEDESNDDLASAHFLDPFFVEMMDDADPRNDQVVVAGGLSTTTDKDVFRFTAQANETFSFDIDSAEFQYSLDSKLELLDANGTILATSLSDIDRDSGFTSVDPNLVFEFASAGEYFIRVSGEMETVGSYRLKVTPERAFDQTGPRVSASWPDGGSTVDSTRQLIFWINDQLDPATLTETNIVVSGQSNGTQTGSAEFDPITSTLTWRADTALPPDTYTVTLLSGAGGITDLRGNLLDGETDGSLEWPELSGNETAGGDFTTTFTVSQADTTPASLNWSRYSRHSHDRAMFDFSFNDELDVLDVYSETFTLRGAGPDLIFNTADDTFSPVDVVYDRISNTASPMLRVYSRGVLDPDTYRVEADLLDAAGNNVTLSQEFFVPITVPDSALFTSATQTTGGLTGSYVNQSLRSYATQDDWRISQTIAGTRVDPLVEFSSNSFGDRSEVNITGGTDANWDNFSVQWDGVITIPADGVRLFTQSDDGSRMWIDINGDGNFDTSGDEFVNNNWGFGQGVTIGPASVPLDAGTYQIRIQYEEGNGGNQMNLVWDYSGLTSTMNGLSYSPKVVDLNVQPNTVLNSIPDTIDVTFSSSIDPSTLNPSSFRVRYSPDPNFFDGNDSYLDETDGAIQWNPSLRQATFEPDLPLINGYYLIELDGMDGGIASSSGQLLDGEYRDTHIAGYTPEYGWNDSPSGDGIPGGDYRAAFSINVVADNDNFVNRIVFGSLTSVTDTGNNSAYTAETGELAQSGTINSAWWSWTAPSNGTLVVDTNGSNFDTFLTVATGLSVDSLTLIDNDDDGGNDLQSLVTISVAAGTQYHIAVDGFDSETGEIVLNLGFAAGTDVGPISDTDLTANEVLENSAVGTLVGITAFAEDPDAGDSVSYSLTDDAGGLFDINASTGVVTVKQASLDYETDTNHLITVEARSTDGSTSSVVFRIDILNDDDASLISRNFYYLDSSFDDGSLDGAAPDKTVLMPGQTATFANYTSYSRGINGVVIDVEDLTVQPTLATVSDYFEFHVGNNDNPDTWATAPAPTGLVYENNVAGTTDRIFLTWPENVIEKTWLEVKVLANATTGLASEDVFYLGNAIGETGNDPANAIVNLADVAGARINQTGFGTADILNRFDFNRDGRVNLADVAIARTNQSGFAPLRLITPSTTGGRESLASGNDKGAKGFSDGFSDGFANGLLAGMMRDPEPTTNMPILLNSGSSSSSSQWSPGPQNGEELVLAGTIDSGENTESTFETSDGSWAGKTDLYPPNGALEFDQIRVQKLDAEFSNYSF